MVSANYIGSLTHHIWTTNQINPAPFGPGATSGNLNARRVLNVQNAAEGKYYGSVQQVDDDGTSNYNGLLMSVQKRGSGGLSIQGNYTISRCQPTAGTASRASPASRRWFPTTAGGTAASVRIHRNIT